jgi:CheY-like chemotaxis protein
MKTILVVEDDPLLGEMLEDYLQLAGYSTQLAGDGEEGLARMRAEHPDMVLCDLHLPRMDGEALARALGKEPGLQAMPFVLMSADSRIVGEGMSRPARLLKPFCLQTLLKTIANHIGDPAC